jgi:ribosome biogenesis protein MAK21
MIPTITDRFYRILYESLLDPRLANSSKHTIYLNLLLRAIKADHDTRRVKAFAKRMLQITSLHQAPFVSGILYVVSQACQAFPDLATLIEDPEDRPAHTDADPMLEFEGYDGRNRNPEYSNAHRGALWELEPLFAHFHPAVTGGVACASSCLEPASKPDLEHHTLMKFLDKISFKAPKTCQHSRGISIMQPYLASGSSVRDSWLGPRSSVKYSAINTPAFWDRKLADVAAEDVFFHRYFSQIPKQHTTSGKSRPLAPEQLSDDEEDEIWKALVSAQDDTDVELSQDTDADGFEDDASIFSDTSSFGSMRSGDEGKAVGNTTDDLLVSQPIEHGDLFGVNNPSWDRADTPRHTNRDDSPNNSRQSKQDRRRSLKGLPTFASADEYEALLVDEDDA